MMTEQACPDPTLSHATDQQLLDELRLRGLLIADPRAHAVPATVLDMPAGAEPVPGGDPGEPQDG